MSVTLEEERMLWERYARERLQAERDVLIARYTPFATMLAARLYGDRQVREIEFDDFRQYALVGLVEAVDRFDPEKGANFRTFSSHRIRGAILNGIEKYSERQQQISARARLREERAESLAKEIAAEQQDTFMRLVDSTIGLAIGYMLEDSRMYQAADDAFLPNAYRSRELSDLARALERLVGTLSEQEQTVVRYHYYQQIRFDQIAATMGLSKGRISQIHHRALQRMREHYEQLTLLRTDY